MTIDLTPKELHTLVCALECSEMRLRDACNATRNVIGPDQYILDAGETETRLDAKARAHRELRDKLAHVEEAAL